MNIEDLREYCLSIKGASESLPFDEYTLLYKVTSNCRITQNDLIKWKTGKQKS
jgi:hypothetical protein